MKVFVNAIYLSWNDTRARYKKSVLGPLWMTLGNLIGIVGLGWVWGHLLHEQLASFIPSLTIGMVIWQFISGTLNEAPTTFIRQAIIIRNVVMPVSFFVIRAFSRQLINLAHNLLIILGVMIYFGLPFNANTLWVIPGLILVILNLFWITWVLGFIGARFRDIEYTIQALLPLLFFISPVIFRIDRLPIDIKIINYNPFAHFIEIVRQPLLGTSVNFIHYQWLLILLLFGVLTGILIQKLYRRYLAFWV
ncbi:MAG: hypothetical protein RL637_1876 [Pseudomonadota bacterium]|jgi:lipopolysaccharide transport system permease protein